MVTEQRLIVRLEDGKGPGKQALVFMNPPTDEAYDFGCQLRLNHYFEE